MLNGKLFFRSQKDLRLIYLWASEVLEMWLVMFVYHQNWICGVTGDVFLLFPAKVLLYSLLIWYLWMEKQFPEVKDELLALEIWLVAYCYHQKSACGVTSDIWLVLTAKILLYLLSICYYLMENHFSEVKKPSTHLIMNFSSTTNIAWYI